jgi:hypothetical protein
MPSTHSEACAGSDVEVNRGEHSSTGSGKPNPERDASVVGTVTSRVTVFNNLNDGVTLTGHDHFAHILISLWMI